MLKTQADLTVEQRELLSAANNGDIAVLQRIATRDNIRFKYGDDSLLHYAALDGHYSCVEFLLEMGIKAGVKNSQDFTPLHCCVLPKSKQKKVSKKLEKDKMSAGI
jgi:ankyrin repeat protein